MAIYEIESEDIKSTMAELVKTAESGDMPMSSALDMESLASWMFAPITDKVLS